jgi:hypothetical protein
MVEFLFLNPAQSLPILHVQSLSSAYSSSSDSMYLCLMSFHWRCSSMLARASSISAVGGTYALVDRVPDLVGADVESAVGSVSPAVPSKDVSQIVHIGSEGTDEDGTEEDTVAADESAFRDVSLC